MLTVRGCLLLNAYFSRYPGQFRAPHSMDKHPGVSIHIGIASFYEANPSCLTDRKSSSSKKWRWVISTLGSLLQSAAYISKNWDAVGWCWGTGLPRKTDTFARVDNLVRRFASNSPSTTGCTMPEWGGADTPKNCRRASRRAFS